MIQINLLPWREQSRLEKKLLLLKRSLGFLGATLFLLLLVHFYQSSLIRQLHNRIDYLQSEINQEQQFLTQLDLQKKQKLALIAQLQYIANLYSQNYQVVKFLNEIVKLMPNNINLEKLNRSGNKIIFAGTAPSESNITQFAQTLSRSSIFERPNITSITTLSNTTRKYFELEMVQKG